MKKYTHAWLAFMAIQRLEKAQLSKTYRKSADQLISWFNNHRDGVMQGAWYPDAVIKDMASSHVLKFKPSENGSAGFRKLPGTYHLYDLGKKNRLRRESYEIASGNLPDRCESLAHSIIDNLKMQEREEKGSPISPTDNHVATIFFMLSHYIADAHMPLHCDSRAFSDGDNIHAHIEGEWDEMIRDCYRIDYENERFFYDPQGYPLKDNDHPTIQWLEKELCTRKFITGWGSGNSNTWDFMKSLCQHSYLLAHQMIPSQYDESNLSWEEYQELDTGHPFEEYSRFILIDAIDSIARVWLRVWDKYRKWMK